MNNPPDIDKQFNKMFPEPERKGLSPEYQQKLEDWNDGLPTRCDICNKWIPPREVHWGNQEDGQGWVCAGCADTIKKGFEQSIKEVAAMLVGNIKIEMAGEAA